MDILLTNDDGIYAAGLWALYHVFSARHSVSVVAPDRERTAVGHGISLHVPLRVQKVSVNGGMDGLAVTGTPADCVKLALLEILDRKPDLVIAGINPGANVGVNINYSGTVAAAKEAALAGVAAIAVSVEGLEPKNYPEAAGFVADLAESVLNRGLPFGTFLNVNLPDRPRQSIAGVRISRQGHARFAEYFEKRVDPRNRIYYWQGSDRQRFEDSLDIDGTALKEGYITVTPIACDMTDYRMLEDLKSWGLGRTSDE
jgi:5'-nucleotidase